MKEGEAAVRSGSSSLSAQQQQTESVFFVFCWPLSPPVVSPSSLCLSFTHVSRWIQTQHHQCSVGPTETCQLITAQQSLLMNKWSQTVSSFPLLLHSAPPSPSTVFFLLRLVIWRSQERIPSEVPTLSSTVQSEAPRCRFLWISWQLKRKRCCWLINSNNKKKLNKY